MRKIKRRFENKNIFIFCEGESEKYYFEGLKKKYRLNIKVDTTHNNTEVKSMFKYIRKYFEYYDKPDLVFIVFDKDNNSEDNINIILKEANKKKYILLYSNPKFEYWVYLHYKYFDQYINGNDLSLKLKYYNYDKADKYLFEKLEKKLNVAYKNAKKVYAKQIKKYDEISIDNNPITLIFKIFDKLNIRI